MNPVAQLADNRTRLSSLKGQAVQVVSDTKYSTKTLAAAAAPAITDFFTTAPSGDPTLDNYDAGNQLVTSAKQFCIQAIAVDVKGSAIADIDAIINKGVVVLTCQSKEIGRFRVRQLSAAGGTFVAGAQVAAASPVGVSNGNPQSDPYRISELLIDTNQNFKASLLMPTANPYVVTAATTVEIDLLGYEVRPTA